MKITNRTSATSTTHYVSIPPEHMKNLRWKKGDEVTCISDKESQSITFIKVNSKNAETYLQKLIKVYGPNATMKEVLKYEANRQNKK